MPVPATNTSNSLVWSLFVTLGVLSLGLVVLEVIGGLLLCSAKISPLWFVMTSMLFFMLLRDPFFLVCSLFLVLLLFGGVFLLERKTTFSRLQLVSVVVLLISLCAASLPLLLLTFHGVTRSSCGFSVGL